MSDDSKKPEGRLAVTLSVKAAAEARHMAAVLDTTVPKVIRMGLSLLRLWSSLKDGEYMMIRRADDSLERVVLWPE